MKIFDSPNNGFKLISLELINNKLLGTIYYDFINKDDKQDSIYTTVIIGPNGTGKSNLFRIIIELFKELYDLSKGNKRSYFVDGQFKLLYSINNIIYEYSNINSSGKNTYLNKKQKHFVFLYKNDKEIKFEDVILPSSIIANSLMLTDKYPVYTKEDAFPIYKYLGVRNTPQNASTRSYVRKTVEFVVDQIDSSIFRNGLSSTIDFLGLKKTIEILYFTSNTAIFFKGNLTPKRFHKYFQAIKRKYKNSIHPPFKLNHYLQIYRDSQLINEICYFCNKLVERKSLENISRSTIKTLRYNITDDSSLRQLKKNFKMLEHLRALGMLTPPDLQLSRSLNYSIQESSSGEYHFFSSMVGLMATIDENSLIFIDEPEVSLHPNWQMNYISFIRQLFANTKYNNSHILIATHSHFLISDLDGRYAKIIGLKRDKKIEIVLLPQNLNTYGWSAEEVLYIIFNVKTTRNLYLEKDLRILLHKIASKSNDYKGMRELLKNLKEFNLSKEDPLKLIINKAEEYLNK